MGKEDAAKRKVIALNRRARHNYEFLERYEAGIELRGTEVKSLRAGACAFNDCYAAVKDGELFLYGMHISPYEHGNRFNVDSLRTRKLLMHKREISRLMGRMQQQGLTLVPSSLYFLNGRVKVELALARGKKNYDKRETLMKHEVKRRIEREIKAHNQQ